MKIKVAAIAKDEGAYIPEWVFHHLHFGFDAVEIWVNNTRDSSIEILNNICQHHDSVTYNVADELLLSCQSRGLFFQIEAYKRILKKSSNEGFTHLIFLDLDELWMPKNFSTNIKDCLTTFDNFDAVSFQWHLDSPNNLSDFCLAIDRCELQKSRIVKTIFKIQDNIKVGIHNHVINNAIYKLADGTTFMQDSSSKNHLATITQNKFKEKTGLDDYFIHHSVYRTKMEYLSSLAKGLKQVNGGDIKNNRWGYINSKNCMPNLSLYIDHRLKKDYINGLSEFILNNNLTDFIESARSNVFKRYQRLISTLIKEEHTVNKYKQVFLGTDIEHILKNADARKFSTYYIDKINVCNEVKIHGWIFLNDGRQNFKIFVLDENGAEIPSKLILTARPDVNRVHPRAPINCGFLLTFTRPLDKNDEFIKKITIILETMKTFGIINLVNN